MADSAQRPKKRNPERGAYPRCSQLTAAKVSNPGFRRKARNSADNSKGISQLGMYKFESSEVSQAVDQLEIAGVFKAETPHL
jgi:hypothetical protein